jgi:hypothetical protein
MLTPELETLDQLLAGDLRLAVIRELYPDDVAFLRGVLGLLNCGDACLLSDDQDEIPMWQWRQLFNEGAALKRLVELNLRITEQGARRIS